MAETAPEIIANPHAALGLEATLTEAWIECLRDSREREARAACHAHRTIVKQLRDLAETDPTQPLFHTDVCMALNVSQRTLNYCCNELLGVGPKRYLTLRRLHQAHRTRRCASPRETTVTEVATRFGFWELGHFALEYQSVFGEAPSVALGR